MIRIFGKWFWNVVIAKLAGPRDADQPALIIVAEDDDD